TERFLSFFLSFFLWMKARIIANDGNSLLLRIVKTSQKLLFNIVFTSFYLGLTTQPPNQVFL
ncbi:hypothetical protein ACJX0J_032693, partial [Zea mays]